MNKNVIRSCWETILGTEPQLLDDPRLPLAHIDVCLAYFDLPPLPSIEAESQAVPEISESVAPSFKELTDDRLVSLRRHVHERTNSDRVAQWAEKLMRFCEVRYHSLKPRAITKCTDQDAAQLHMLQLAAFLMDHAIETRDVRPLNTVLKLSDLKWILNRQAINRDLITRDSRFVLALFQFRVLLASEYFVDRLARGEAL